MLFKIGDKYYVKMRNYYKELDFIEDNIVPSKKENTIIKDMSVLVTPMSYEEILKEFKQTKQVEEIVFKYKKRKNK